MKRILAILLALILIFTLTACGSKADNAPSTDPAPEAGSKTEKEEKKPAEEQTKEYLADTEFLKPNSVTSVQCRTMAEEDYTTTDAVEFAWWFYVFYENAEDAEIAAQEYTDYLNSNFPDLTDSKGNKIILPEFEAGDDLFQFGLVIVK